MHLPAFLDDVAAVACCSPLTTESCLLPLHIEHSRRYDLQPLVDSWLFTTTQGRLLVPPPYGVTKRRQIGRLAL